MVVLEVSDRIDMLDGIFRTTGGFWFATLLRWTIDEADAATERVEAADPAVAVRALGGLLATTSDGGFLGSTGRRTLGALDPLRDLATLVETTEVAL
jgi:hypothetical protein